MRLLGQKRQLAKLSIVTGVVVAFLGLLGFIWAFLRGAMLEQRLDFTPELMASSLGSYSELLGFQLVNFSEQAGLEATAFYRPASSSHAVVLVHGAGGHRGQLLDEAHLLANHGYGVLSIDLPGHGGSSGEIRWGRGEKDRILQAVSWMRRQLQACGRIGVYGFSMGSWMGLKAAVASPSISAVVLAGSFDDPKNLFQLQVGRLGWPAYLGTISAAWRMDYDYKKQIPAELIQQYSPRPVLFLSGGRDETTPVALSDRLYRLAFGAKHRYLALGAGHGNYLGVDRDGVSQSLLAFLAAYLAKPEGQGCGADRSTIEAVP